MPNPTEKSTGGTPVPRWKPVPRVICLLSIATLAIAGCISDKPFNPAATQPATEVDLSTTQPSTYWSAPAVATVSALQFQPIFDASVETLRIYGFEIDRRDYREGLLTSKPLISKQLIEPWRRDSGSAGQVMENSMATIRRTVHFVVDRQPDGTYSVTPKVLVERLTILEHRVTSAIQYRSIFAGPASMQSRTSVAADQPDELIPIRYFTPLYRDLPLEKQMAETLRNLLKKQGQSATLKFAQK
jgi:hypothetical protein